MKGDLVNVEVTPNTCLVDDEFHIRVTGLLPNQKITLVCRVAEEGIRLWSYAHYVGDTDGVVDVTSMPSQGGRYVGVEPMGLIWSQKQDPGQSPGRRLAKTDVTVPLVTHVYVLDAFRDADDCLNSVDRGRYLSQAVCHRVVMAEGVERIGVKEGRLLGTLFIPEGSGPFPGVIDLFGTVGGIVEHRSAMLANRGIASLTLSYFTPGRGEGLITDLEYIEEGVDYLLRNPKVLKPHVGIIGVSKGAELALSTASMCPNKIKACVSINGLDIFTLVTHTYRGTAFPCRELDYGKIESSECGYSFSPAYDISEEDREPYQIPVERGQCQYLLIHGAADKSMPSSATEHIVRRLQKFGKTNYRFLLYPGAGHLLEPPHSPHFVKTWHSGVARPDCTPSPSNRHGVKLYISSKTNWPFVQAIEI